MWWILWSWWCGNLYGFVKWFGEIRVKKFCPFAPFPFITPSRLRLDDNEKLSVSSDMPKLVKIVDNESAYEDAFPGIKTPYLWMVINNGMNNPIKAMNDWMIIENDIKISLYLALPIVLYRNNVKVWIGRIIKVTINTWFPSLWLNGVFLADHDIISNKIRMNERYDWLVR